MLYLIVGLKEFIKVVQSPSRPWNKLNCFGTIPILQVTDNFSYIFLCPCTINPLLSSLSFTHPCALHYLLSTMSPLIPSPSRERSGQWSACCSRSVAATAAAEEGARLLSCRGQGSPPPPTRWRPRSTNYTISPTDSTHSSTPRSRWNY